MRGPLIRVERAVSRIGKQATLSVEQFELTVGQHWCVFGGNGAGKTLFMRLLTGQLVSGRSQVSYATGFSLAQIEFVSFEEQQRLCTLDARHDISEYSADVQDQGTTVASLILGNATPDDAYSAIIESLQLTKLQGRGIRYLSSGQIRKTQIARSLYRKPQLLILDEPLESIDSASQAHIISALTGWMTPHTTSLLICRRAQDILPNVSHMMIMDSLKILRQGDVQSVVGGDDFNDIVNQQALVPSTLPSSAASRRLPDLDRAVALIRLENVSAAYGQDRIISDLFWVMQSHHHTLIEGPNGCGKSTLLSLINGENHKAYGQEVYLFGRKRGSGETVWDIKARFGVVSNELHNKYVQSWRVIDVVVSGFYDSVGLFDDSGAAEQELAGQWLNTFGLKDSYAKFYDQLSFGQQRLVLLARAMVKHPRILILDEPCVGLDDYHRRLILGVVDMIAASGATQIIFVSHLREEYPSCINQRITFSTEGIVVDE
jgi:molybdate transport system ATP-binding protein